MPIIIKIIENLKLRVEMSTKLRCVFTRDLGDKSKTIPKPLLSGQSSQNRGVNYFRIFSYRRFSKLVRTNFVIDNEKEQVAALTIGLATNQTCSIFRSDNIF